MKNRQFIVFALLLACPLLLHGQETFLCGKESCNKGYIRHPWYGKKVGYIGDSITDPNCYGDSIKKYWDFLKEWLDITPYVYGVSGRQWNDVPRQAEQLKKEHGEEVQPDESYQNKCGEYVDAYVQAIKEAGNLWGVPVIDFNSVTGMNPMIEEQLIYFYDSGYDRLHPNTNGQERMAHTLMYQLLSLPASF